MNFISKDAADSKIALTVDAMRKYADLLLTNMDFAVVDLIGNKNLPLSTVPASIIICLLSSVNDKEGHWVVFFKTSTDTIFFNPVCEEVSEFLKRIREPIDIKLSSCIKTCGAQKYNTNTCGWWCLALLYLMELDTSVMGIKDKVLKATESNVMHSECSIQQFRVLIVFIENKQP